MIYNELLKLSKVHSRPLTDNGRYQYTNDVTWILGTSSLPSLESIPQPLEGMRPQYLRAYEYWHQKKLTLEEMCLKLSLKNKGHHGSTKPGKIVALKPGTVM